MSVSVRIERATVDRIVITIDHHIPHDQPGGCDDLMTYIMACSAAGEPIVLRIVGGQHNFKDAVMQDSA